MGPGSQSYTQKKLSPDGHEILGPQKSSVFTIFWDSQEPDLSLGSLCFVLALTSDDSIQHVGTEVTYVNFQ